MVSVRGAPLYRRRRRRRRRHHEGWRAGLRVRAYTLLSRALFPKSYLAKIMLGAFVGIPIPLVALVLYLFLIARIDLAEALPTLALVLVATVVGGALTLFALYALLAPVSAASRALRAYLERGGLPRLPTRSSSDDDDDEEEEEEAGKLLFDVQHIISHLEEDIRSLEELSAKDPLTGAYNRRACEERLAEDVARVERGRETLALAALDADRLKEINDRHGHAAGDACLRHLASIIERIIRKSDWFARWGGDEFVVALWDAKNLSMAEAIVHRTAEDLRRNPARLPQGGEERLTASAGIAWHRGGEDARELVERADAALLRAKRQGRGKIARAT
jgi:diguanylate cyclase (GGDEF)-like protein